MSWFLKRALPAGIVALSAVVAGAPKAEAFGWHHGGGSSGGSSGYGGWGSSGGSSGYAYAAYGSSGGSSGYSYGSSGGSSGHHRVGLMTRIHNFFHHHHRGHGSSGGSSGYSYGSSGGSSGYSYGSSGGSSGAVSYGSSGGSSGGSAGGHAYYGGYGMYNGMPVVAADAPADAAVLQVSVPADAKVFVNGYQTTSVGTERRYVSNGLEAGKSYTYELKAEAVVNGNPVSETKVVKLTAGQTETVAFTFAAPAAPAVNFGDADEAPKTKLTLHVPADAKVFISGKETKATGEVREFATTKLAAGKTWDNYLVRIEVTRDGQLVSHEQKLSLVGGESQELEFDLEAPAPKLAAK
jgi:uncharacterized protein (TIGR03000 family)